MGEVNRRGYWSVLPGEVKQDTELTIAAKYLYIILSSMAYDDGYCWPSNEYLAGEIGLSKRRVVELLALLRDRGYIRITMQASAASHTGEQRFIYCGMFPDRERSGPPAEGCEIPHGEGANHRVGGCEKSHGEGEIFRSAYKGRKTKKKYNTPLPPNANSQEDVAVIFDEYAGADRELRQRLADFQESRQKIRKPLHTQRAAKIFVNKLDRLSGGDRACKLALLDNAILHSWESVYPLKPDELPQAAGGPAGQPVTPDGGKFI
jgi:hypothetical protein